jgi:ribosomal protein S17
MNIAMKIEKQTWPEYFKKIVDGEKAFDLRLANFRCKPGDIIVFREWNPKTKKYTGRAVEKKVTYVLKTKNLKFWPKKDIEKYGFQVFSLR